MNNLHAGTDERRKTGRDVITKLIEERTEMLTVFCRLAGVEPYAASNKSVQELLQEFCQILVDYVAAGHFALYERIIEGKERRKHVAQLAAEIYPRISKSTDASLDFNDKYDCEDHCTKLDSLSADLSRLGEDLAARIELEDRLIEALARKG